MENNIEEFIEAMAEWFDARQIPSVAYNADLNVRLDNSEYIEAAKQKAEEAMKKAIRTELKIVGAE